MKGDETAAEIARLRKMVSVLMDQVEAGMNSHGSDFGLFRTTILLEEKVRERTLQLEEVLAAIGKSNRELMMAKEAAETAELRLAAAIDNISEGFSLFDAKDRLVLFNDRFREIWQKRGVSLSTGQTFAEILLKVVASGLVEGASPEWVRWRLDAHRSARVGSEFRLADGAWIKVSERHLQDGGTVGIYTDVTDIKRREEERRERELARKSQLLQATLDNLSQGVAVFDRDLRLVTWNTRFVHLLQLPEAMVVTGLPYDRLAAYDMEADRRAEGGPPPAPSVPAVLERRFPWGAVIEVRRNPMPDGGFVSTYTDITERKMVEQLITHMATHDSLTNLANRTLFNDRIQQALAGAERFGHRCAVHFLDLNNFKMVNDTLGHHIGDQLIRGVAQRLSPLIREIDTLARLGGDEFAVIQNYLSDPREAGALAERLLGTFEAPFHVDGKEIRTTASIGITVFPHDARDADGLVRNADMAMYQAKAERRNRYFFFQPEMDRQMSERRQLEEDLRAAIDAEQFFLVYQPKIETASGRLSGMEALVRWQHPRRGVLGPDTFIPLAEQTGLIVSLGEWVLTSACSQARRWLDRGWGGLRVAVNLSPLQFKSTGPLPAITAALAESGLSPENLEVELTETALMEDMFETNRMLCDIHRLGISVAVDDFGTGYSSLGYLSSFPIDCLKIDRTFVQGIDRKESGAAIVRAIVSLAHSLGMRVVAEGVEEGYQRDFLEGEGCDEIQGFLVSRPLVPTDFEAFLRSSSLSTQALG